VTPLASVIADLQAATGASRELDARIAEAIGWKEGYVGDDSRGYFVPRYKAWFDPKGNAHVGEVAEYTRSWDAALSLHPGGGFSALQDTLALLLERINSGTWKSGPDVTHDDIAICACIAALKAIGHPTRGKRETGERNEHGL
jgi:hypothetical protein